MERICLAFSKNETALKIRDMLEGTGYVTDNVICHNAAELFRHISDYDNVLIIMGYRLPDMVADEVYEHLNPGCKLMSIVRGDHIDDIYNEEIFILSLPLSRQKLISSINVFCGQIHDTVRGKKSGRTPEEEKTIESAKLFLMEHYHMTEQQAHRFIQKRSMDTGAKFIDTARLILNTE